MVTEGRRAWNKARELRVRANPSRDLELGGEAAYRDLVAEPALAGAARPLGLGQPGAIWAWLEALFVDASEAGLEDPIDARRVALPPRLRPVRGGRPGGRAARPGGGPPAGHPLAGLVRRAPVPATPAHPQGAAAGGGERGRRAIRQKEVMSYPAIPLDGAGPRLLFGDCVLVRAGTHAGRVAEVVGWGGRRGVELIVHGPVPAFVALPPALVEPVDTPLLDPVLPCRRGRTEPAALPAAAGPCCGETRGGSLGPSSPGGRLVAGRYDQQARAGRGPGRTVAETGPAEPA